MRSVLLPIFSLLLVFNLNALDVYNAGNTYVTGIWNVNGTLSEVSSNMPYEGSQHYQFNYTIGGFWAGFGLNMDNWGSSPARNLSGFTHMRIAYRGLTGDNQLRIQLRNGSTYGTIFTLGSSSATYRVVDIPIVALVGGSYIDLNAIREIDISVGSDANSGTGAVYIDAIEMLNLALPPASNAWTRSAGLTRGFNLSNWLEAWWLLPFNSYPEVGQFTRAKVQLLYGMGYQSMRMTVIFERLGNPNPPYNLDTTNLAFDLIDSVIVWAQDYNMTLIIDNHHGLDLTDANYAAQIPRICAVWRQIIQRYSYLDPERTFFELYNEPTGSISNTNLRTVLQTVRDTIRNHNTTHTLIFGGNGYNSANGLLGFNPVNETNAIYTFHSYTPFYFTHQGMSWTQPPNFPARNFPIGTDVEDMSLEFRSVAAWSIYYNIPVFLGEFGVGTSANLSSKCAWIEEIANLADSIGVSHFYWDVFRWDSAFGFFQNGVLELNQVIPCFAEAMDLNLIPLSVKFEQINPICEGQKPLLEWTAQVNDRGALFYLESSGDFVKWDVITQLAAQEGLQDYRLEPVPFAPTQYYRIRYQMADGQLQYSKILRFDCAVSSELMVYPNPSNSPGFTLQLPANIMHDGIVQLFNSTGQLVAEKQSNSSKISCQFDDLIPGRYEIVFRAQNGEMKAVGWILN